MRIAQIACYPVKSLRGHALERAVVEPIGISGDRRWAVINANGRVQTQRELSAMATIDVRIDGTGIVLAHATHGMLPVQPDERAGPCEVSIWRDHVRARFVSREADAFLSAVLGKPLRLVHFHDPGARPTDPVFGRPGDHVSLADGFPLLVTTSESLADLNRRLDAPVEMRRFRPNVVIEGGDAWAEDTWRVLRIGALTVRIVKSCSRCVITTLDPDSGAPIGGGQPLAALRGFHRAADGGIIFGQNAIPDHAAEIAVGDEVEVIEAGASNLG